MSRQLVPKAGRTLGHPGGPAVRTLALASLRAVLRLLAGCQGSKAEVRQLP